MRSAPQDRTTRAVIRDEALRLFAEHGPDRVAIRQVAAAAGVSPGLVVHHFRTKEGLRGAVDQHVLGASEAMLGELTGEAAPDVFDASATGSPARRSSRGGAAGHTWLASHLLLGLAWAAALALTGLIIFCIRSRSRTPSAG